MPLFQKGHKVPKEWKEKLSEAQTGKRNSPKTEFKKGMTPWNKGLKGVMKAWNKGKHIGGNPEALKKYREENGVWNKGKKMPTISGENHPNWNGGKSFELYGLEFNIELKEKIRERDNHRCQQCFRHQDELYSKSGRKYKLHIHHIDYNKQNNNKNNLISLCRNCHLQTNFKREDWINYFKEKCLTKS